MTTEILLSLAILGGAVILFVTEWLRIDLVALLVLAALALTGLVTPDEAISGFSNPAVVTVWAIFILSGGLSRTGAANILGKQVMRLAGEGEARLVLVIMLTAGSMSAFMNNVGVVALLLPVVLDISRRTGHPRSRLLMPLAFGSLLGGLTSLIGTPANILASDALQDFGLQPFMLFDFAYVGVPVLIAGTLFMAFAGRHLLPAGEARTGLARTVRATLGQVYHMRDLLFVIHIRPTSALVGRSLAQSRIGSALGLNVFGVIREGQILLAPESGFVFRANDRLLVAGPPDQLAELHGWQNLIIEGGTLMVDSLISDEIDLVEARPTPESSLIGQTLEQLGFRRQYGVNVLAIRRNGTALRTHLQHIPIQPEDVLLIQAPREKLEQLNQSPDLVFSDNVDLEKYRLQERLLKIEVPPDSSLIGKTLEQTRFGDAFGLTVLGIQRNGTSILAPDPSEKIRSGDTLLVEGRQEDVLLLLSLQDLRIDRDSLPDLRRLESEEVGLTEAVLSPHTTLAGKTLRELHFREKYGLTVLAIWREGKAYHLNLRDMALKFGDALLLYGPWDKFQVLGREPDFLVLGRETQEPFRLSRAPVAALIMAAVVGSVIMGWLPISIAAVIGGALMVLTGCLNMEEAYRFIDWPAVFLIAGMLPLGIAMQKSGAARYLAEVVIAGVGVHGSIALLAGLFLLTGFASQFMPNPVVTVLMAPIALNTAQNQGLSPYALMMVIAVAASSSFVSPVGHATNVLVMGPGGYQFKDYIRVGVPLLMIVLIVTLLLLPLSWPLAGQ